VVCEAGFDTAAGPVWVTLINTPATM
jgi:hypothetical protein